MGIEIIGKLTQKNNGDFKLVDLADVDYDGTGKNAKQELEKKIEEAKNSSTPYDDTEIKTDINTIKTDLGSEELTTTAKNVKGAVNEVAAQYKEIVNNKADKNDLQVQKSRIDNLATLKEGSTTGDAELIDGRIGANGGIYSNLGSAIRNQFKNIIDGSGAKINKYDNKLNYNIEQMPASPITTNSTGATLNSSMGEDGYRHYIVTQTTANGLGMVVATDYRNCTFSKGQEFLMSYKSTIDFKVNFRSFDSSNNKLDDFNKTVLAGSGDIIVNYDELNNSATKLGFILIEAKAGSTGEIDIYNFRVYDKTVTTDNINLKKLDEKINKIGCSRWIDKNGITLGDSITYHDGKIPKDSTETLKGYASYLKQLGFANVDNKGVSGACIANHSNSPYTDICVTVDSINFSNYDFVSIAGGINDYIFWNSTLGSITDSNFDKTTFIGGLQYIINKILTDNPLIQIVIFTPLKQGIKNNKNDVELNLTDYVNAIKNVAEYYSIPILDLYSISGFNKYNISKYTLDLLHPNNLGYKTICETKMLPLLNNI